jgi:serine/threonine-protein kinase
MGSAITGALVVRSHARTTTPVVTRWLHTLDEGQQFTNNGRTALSVSPDGSQIVYVANRLLYLRSMAEVDARPIRGADGTGSVPVSNPVFSPNGRFIVFYSDHLLKKIAVTGGATTTLCEASNPYGISWDQEDTIVFGQLGKGIVRVPATGGTSEVVARVKDTEIAEGPQLLPGGETVLFTVATGIAPDQWDHAQIVAQSLESGVRKTLVEGGSWGRYVPTGHLVYAVGGSLLAVPFDVTGLEVKGDPTRVIEGVLRGFATGTAHFSVSGTGTLIYIPGPAGVGRLQKKLAWIDRQGHVEPLPLPVAPYEHPRIAPDGRHIAYDIDNGKDANVWTYDLSGTRAPQQLTSSGRNRMPEWSPDSQRVAFQSDREGDAAIFWQRADGTDNAERLTRPEHGISHVPVSWFADTLLFDVTAGSDISLWSLSLRDKKAAPFDAVHSTTPTAAAFSPDGRWVAYTVGQGGLFPVFVLPFPPTDAPPRQVVPNGVHPFWSQDGELFFNPSQIDFALVRVWTHPTFGFSNQVPLPKAGADDGGPTAERNNDIARDGRRFLAVVPNVVSQPKGSGTGSIAPQIEVVEHWFEELKRVSTK